MENNFKILISNKFQLHYAIHTKIYLKFTDVHKFLDFKNKYKPSLITFIDI